MLGHLLQKPFDSTHGVWPPERVDIEEGLGKGSDVGNTGFSIVCCHSSHALVTVTELQRILIWPFSVLQNPIHQHPCLENIVTPWVR